MLLRHQLNECNMQEQLSAMLFFSIDMKQQEYAST